MCFVCDNEDNLYSGVNSIFHWPDGTPKCIVYGSPPYPSNIYGPAVIAFHKNGSVDRCDWYLNGILHRMDGPASILFYDTGKIRHVEWWENGEAGVNNPGSISYHTNGSIDNIYWYENNISSKIDGPAIEYFFENGNKKAEMWYINGTRHRIDGPAESHWNKNGKLKMKFWYINGIEVSDEVKKWLKIMKLNGKKWTDEDKLLFKMVFC